MNIYEWYRDAFEALNKRNCNFVKVPLRVRCESLNDNRLICPSQRFCLS